MLPEPSSSRARRPTVFVGSCRSLARLFGCQRCAQKRTSPANIIMAGRQLPNRSDCLGASRSQGDGQGGKPAFETSMFLAPLSRCSPSALHPSPALITLCKPVTMAGQLVEQGREDGHASSSTFRFIPSIEIIPAGRGPVPRTDSTSATRRRDGLCDEQCRRRRCESWSRLVPAPMNTIRATRLEVYNTYPE